MIGTNFSRPSMFRWACNTNDGHSFSFFISSKNFLFWIQKKFEFMFVFRNQFKINRCGPHDQSIFASLETALKLSSVLTQAETFWLGLNCYDIIGQLNTGLVEWFKSWQGHSYRVGIVCSSWLEQGNKKFGAKRWLGQILAVPLCSAGLET